MDSTIPRNNINNFLDQDNLNFNYLPQTIGYEDIDRGVRDYIKSLNLSITDENGVNRPVPIVFTTQELWAERQQNWKSFRGEYGEEITRPFLALTRTSVGQGTSPLKRTIPKKKKFTFVKVPIMDGNLKNYVYYKIPQPVWTDIGYELTFVTFYMLDVNKYLEVMIRDGYSDGQGYMNIKGYHITSKIEGTSQTKEEEMTSENLYEISFQILVYGKILDATQFEKVSGVNKFLLKTKVIEQAVKPRRPVFVKPPQVIVPELLFAVFENSFQILFEDSSFMIFESSPEPPPALSYFEDSNEIYFENNFSVAFE